MADKRELPVLYAVFDNHWRFIHALAGKVAVTKPWHRVQYRHVPTCVTCRFRTNYGDGCFAGDYLQKIPPDGTGYCWRYDPKAGKDG